MRRINQAIEQEKHRNKQLNRFSDDNVKKLNETHFKLFATKRLMKDLQEITKNPLPTVVARPLEGNIFEWHGNIQCHSTGTSFDSLVFHLVIEFSVHYPMKPPRVKLCNYLHHSHVFNEFICLDMLETNSHAFYNETRSFGWSSGYTLQSILMQLQSFLLDTKELKISDATSIMRTQRSIQTFVCKGCGHCYANPYPKLENNDHKKQGIHAALNSIVEANEKRLSNCWLPATNMSHLYHLIFSYVDIKTLNLGVWNTCTSFRHLLKSDPKFQIRTQIVCYHTKMTFEEAVLGYGINIEYDKSNKIQYIHTELDLISYFAAYKEGITTSLWKDPFNFWIPVYINKRHGQVILEDPRFLIASIERIYKQNFQPKLALDLLTKAMNSMIVLVMKGVMHASLKAIDGYISFHRLLVAVLEKYPELQQTVESKIQDFLDNPVNRSKNEFPSLGDFLPYLTVSTKFNWSQLAIPVLQEVLCRNVYWTLKQYPSLGNITSQRHFPSSIRQRRMIQSFSASQVSLRLIMFHVQFLKHFSPKGNMSLRQLAGKYDEFYGVASPKIKELFQKKLFQIQKVANYEDFFRKCCLEIKHDKFIDEMLTDSWILAKQKGYID